MTYAKNPTILWNQRSGMLPRLVWDRGQRSITYDTYRAARAARAAVIASGPYHSADEILAALKGQ